MFDSKSYKIFTTSAKIKSKVDSFREENIQRVTRSFYFSSRLNFHLSNLQINTAVKKVVKSADSDKPKLIIGTFPDYYFLKIARETAKELKIPLAAYLHDTIVESHCGTRLKNEAKMLQEQVFSEASVIFVMSEGMKNLYKKKYSIDTIALEHTYLEPIPGIPENNEVKRQAFWGGDIYAININSVKRVSQSLKKNKVDFYFATGANEERLQKIGIWDSHTKRGFISNRSEYLNFLKKNQILVLALDWPDESPIHRDELATIFPTKTPEYLASGRPIIVHCPEDYFLAEFFKKHNCGIIVSERSEEALNAACIKLLNSNDELLEIQNNALKAAQVFESNEIAVRFQKFSNMASLLSWNQKL